MEVLCVILSFGAAVSIGILKDASNADIAIVGWLFGFIGGGIAGMIVASKDRKPVP